MEQFNQSQGFMLYSLPWNSLISSIALYGVHDRALVYLDSVLYGNIMRPNGTLALLEPTSVTLVQILVENLGRVNHGSYMGQDFKGLTKSVVIDGEDVTSKVWSVCPLELDTKHDFPDYPPHYKGAYPPHYSPYYSPRDLTRLAKLAEDESIPYYNGKQYETEAYPDYQTDEDQSAKPEPQTERVAVTEQEHQSTPNQQEPQSTPNQREPKLGVYTPSFYCSFIPKYQNTHSLDTFLDPTGWGKGVLFLNGINIGRYWPSEGPQVTLYVPGVWFSSEQHQGKSNLLCLLELEKPSDSLTVRFVDKPQLSLPATKAG